MTNEDADMWFWIWFAIVAVVWMSLGCIFGCCCMRMCNRNKIGADAVQIIDNNDPNYKNDHIA